MKYLRCSQGGKINLNMFSSRLIVSSEEAYFQLCRDLDKISPAIHFLLVESCSGNFWWIRNKTGKRQIFRILVECTRACALKIIIITYVMNETGYNMLNLTIANPDNKADVLLEAFNFARLK